MISHYPNLLSNKPRVKLSDDPYALGKVILPELVTTMEEQRELRQASSPDGDQR